MIDCAISRIQRPCCSRATSLEHLRRVGRLIASSRGTASDQRETTATQTYLRDRAIESVAAGEHCRLQRTDRTSDAFCADLALAQERQEMSGVSIVFGCGRNDSATTHSYRRAAARGERA